MSAISRRVEMVRRKLRAAALPSTLPRTLENLSERNLTAARPAANSGQDVSIVRPMSAATVGVCEDDHQLRSLLSRALSTEGLEVRCAVSGHEAIELFTRRPPDALVLDIGLPDSDGRDVCQALRAHGVTAPVLFLSAREALPDRLAGFHAGGDDYMTKPFALEELLVRVRALLRRPPSAPVEEGPGLRLDPAAHRVRRHSRSAALTPTEFRLLAALAARPGEVVRRNELVAAGWPNGAIVHQNTLDTYVKRLRRKLRDLEADEAITTLSRAASSSSFGSASAAAEKAASEATNITTSSGLRPTRRAYPFSESCLTFWRTLRACAASRCACSRASSVSSASR